MRHRSRRRHPPLPPGFRPICCADRPDIRVAERDLAAATADVGVATADLFPRLRLGLSIGQQARALWRSVQRRFDAPSGGPGLSWPVFSGGSVKARIRVANARVDQAAARYDAAVINALTDSENGDQPLRTGRWRLRRPPTQR